MKEKNKLKFECECNGCRNYPRRPAQIYHESQLSTVTNGFFFSPDTMKWFKSRVSDFKPVGINKGQEGKAGESSLMVIVSSKWGDDSPRHYEIVIVCPYGEVWRESDEQITGLVKYETLNQARKSDLWRGSYSRDRVLCTCHGCQLDEAGR